VTAEHDSFPMTRAATSNGTLEVRWIDFGADVRPRGGTVVFPRTTKSVATHCPLFVLAITDRQVDNRLTVYRTNSA
jgi:hypothetical protein